MDSCNHIKELMGKQLPIIKRHLNQHKWFNGIADEGKAVEDFIAKYGWLMREMFCSTCRDSVDCDYYRNNFGESDEKKENYLENILYL